MPPPTGPLTAAERVIIRNRHFEQKAFDQRVADANFAAALELGAKLKAFDPKG
jgi:hypothetical protein